MEVVLGDPCQEFVTVEASRNPRFHNKFAVLGPRRVLPGPFAPMNSKLCVVSMDSVAPLMRGRVNVGFSVIAEWLSEWGITLLLSGRQEAWGGATGCLWGPVLLEGLVGRPSSLKKAAPLVHL
jgi:hypothetical protein